VSLKNNVVRIYIPTLGDGMLVICLALSEMTDCRRGAINISVTMHPPL
jgi:hypothetical protein